MKILYVIGRLGVGGDSTAIFNTLEVLVGEGLLQKDNIDFVTHDIGYNKEKVDSLRKEGYRVYIMHGDVRKMGVISYYVEMKKLMKMYGPYDVMHIHTSIQSGIALCVAKSSKISKRVCHAHTNSIQRSTSKISKIFLTPLFRYLIHIAATDRVACSDMAGKFLYKKDKFEILKNGIDLQKFEKITDEEVSILRSTLSNDGKYYLVGHVGRFSDMKNQDFILKIASKFKNKNIKFIFVGDGDNFEIIKNKAVESNINVEFLGRRDDIPVIMSAIDLLLLPSLPGEGFPVTLVEAQATGCPCVVSNNVTAEADLGMGLVQFYDLDDERAWENYIDKTPNLRKLRKESIECVRTLEFDKKTVALNWMKVYNGN